MKKLAFFLLLLVSTARAQNITKIEYWIDVDPGFGNAIPDTNFVHQPDVQTQFQISGNLSVGAHVVGVRSKDTTGRWSETNVFSVFISDSSNGEITLLEYFWDVDPGFGNGIDTVLGFPQTDFSTGWLFAYVPNSFTYGSNHYLYVRSKDSRGRWSETNYMGGIFMDTCYVSRPLNIFGHDSLCFHSSEIYSIPPVHGATGYIWSVPSGWNIDTDMGDSIIVTSGNSTGNISVQSINGCDTSSATVFPITTTYALPNLTWNQFSLTTLVYSSDPPIVLTGAVPAGGLFTGTNVSGDTLYPQFFNPTDTIIITYMFTDTNGCADSINNTVRIEYDPTKVENLGENNSIRFTPNPAHNELFIECNRQVNSIIHIFDILGNEIITDDIHGFNKQINISTLAGGVYFIELYTESGSIVKRFIKD